MPRTSKYEDWIIIFTHPIANKVTWRNGPPHSLVLYHMAESKVTAFLELQWRDMKHKEAYYKVSKFVPD